MWGIESVICQSVSLQIVPTWCNLFWCEHTHSSIVMVLLFSLAALSRLLTLTPSCLLRSSFKGSLSPRAISFSVLGPNRGTHQKPPSISHSHYPEWTPSDPYQLLHHDETVCSGLVDVDVCVCVWIRAGVGWRDSHGWRQMSVLPLSTIAFSPNPEQTQMRRAAAATANTE